MTKELLQQALDALIESRDDVLACLHQHRRLPITGRYDKLVPVYEAQLIKHDASIEGLKQALALAQQERSYPVAEYEDGQWWVKELESLFVAPIGSGVTADQKRAANIALNFMRTVWAQQEQPASVDAYVGAREDAAIWKKRALEAEELNRKFIAELNGPTYLGEPAQQEQPSKTERQIRRMFCVTYASDSSPYMDDGEAQDNSRHPCIDFLRDSPEQIQSKMVERAIAKHKAQQEQPASVDAYVGAREDAAIWKKRALEAEELNRKFIADVNGPTYLGEPVKQEQPAQEPVTVLPDGSAFGVMSFPLPSDHWLYRDREYPTPESTETVDLPPPFVPRTIENLELIRLAAKWAIRAATDCGKENDFDPDAIVQNFVYATLGPYPQKIKDTAPTQPALSEREVELIDARLEVQQERHTPSIEMLACDVASRPLSYPLHDYHTAPLEGPLNYTWQDKPHRLLYDLIAAVKFYAKAQQEQLALTPINVDVTFSRGDIEELPEDQCPEWCAGSSDRDVKVHVHLGDAQPALSDERLAEIAKPFISAMGDHWCHEDGIRDNGTIEEFARAVIEAHCRGGANHGC